MANRLDGHSGAVRVVSYVVSGIGFLGAGVIMREQGNVREELTKVVSKLSAAPVISQTFRSPSIPE